MRARLQWTVLMCLVLAAPSAGSETPSAEDTVSEPQTGGGDEEQDGEQGRAEDDEKPPWKQPLKVNWDAGLHIYGKWDYLHLKIAGDVQNDTAGYVNAESAEELLDTAIDSGVEWRRARAYAEGRLFRHLNFKLRYDFTAGNPPNLKDAFFSFVNLPIPTLGFTVGRFRAPLGLDGYTGADDTVFMERSLMSEAFLPSRNTGFMLHGDSPAHRIRWSFAVLQPEADSIDLSSTDNLGWSARFAWALKAGTRKRTLVHLGADFWRRNVDTTIQYASPPESHLAPFFVDTGDVPADSSDIAVAEAAVQNGRWKAQAEFAYTRVGGAGRESLSFHGFYVQGSCFLTGETAPYRTDRGTFTRPYPRRSLREGGIGALELGFRYSRIDLSDRRIAGGILADWSAGFNWYPTYHLKFMFNAILANLEGAKPAGIFQMRLQVAY